MSKVYLSGPISGIKTEWAMQNFEFAKKEVNRYIKPKEVVNPFDIKPFLGLKNWWCYMATDLWALRKCDTIFMLRGWKNSRGACIEHLYALWNKKIIIYQE